MIHIESEQTASGIHCNEAMHLLDFWGDMLMSNQIDITDKQQEWMALGVEWLLCNSFLYLYPLHLISSLLKPTKEKAIQVKYGHVFHTNQKLADKNSLR